MFEHVSFVLYNCTTSTCRCCDTSELLALKLQLPLFFKLGRIMSKTQPWHSSSFFLAMAFCSSLPHLPMTWGQSNQQTDLHLNAMYVKKPRVKHSGFDLGPALNVYKERVCLFVWLYVRSVATFRMINIAEIQETQARSGILFGCTPLWVGRAHTDMRTQTHTYTHWLFCCLNCSDSTEHKAEIGHLGQQTKAVWSAGAEENGLLKFF